jgi:hypothetical protein
VLGKVGEHPPDGVGGGVNDGDSGPAPGGPARPAWGQRVQEDDLATVETLQLLGGQPERVGVGPPGCDNHQGQDQRAVNHQHLGLE